MKNLKEYILEGAVRTFTTNEIKHLFRNVSISPEIIRLMDSFCMNFLGSLERSYSLTNKTDRGYLYNIFKKTIGQKYDKGLLRSLLLSNENCLSSFLLDNIDLINSKSKKELLTQKMNKFERKLKEWKENPNYIPLEEYDEDDEYLDDEELGRAFVIYYAYDPSDKSSLRVFRVNGKTTDPKVKHIINLCKADWNYETKLGYYHANPCTVEHYRKSNKDQLIQDFINNEIVDEE